VTPIPPASGPPSGGEAPGGLARARRVTNVPVSRFFIRRRGMVAAYGIAVVLFTVGTIHSIGFAAPSNLRFLLFSAAVVGIVGFGQGLCILVGGIDLSLPYTMTGGAVLVARFASEHIALPVIILIIAGLGISVGLLNGFGIAFLSVPPIIMTLGTQGVLQGLLLLYTNGSGSAAAPGSLVHFANDEVLGLSLPIWIWFAVIAGATVFLAKTTVGRKLYVIGNNRRAARLAGIKVRRLLFVPYVVSALCGALAGVFLMAYTGGAYLSLGDPYLFESAAAVAVGGASILGGNGNYIGTVGGALALTLMVSLLTLLSVGQAWLNVGYGAILLAALIIAAPDLNILKVRPAGPDEGEE
jgi:ribose transport system permease protein